MEDYVSSFKNSSSDNSYFDSDLESKCSWEKNSDDFSDNSFDSSKLMDGYKDFVINQQRHQAKRAKEEAEKEAGKNKQSSKKKTKKEKKTRRSKKQRKDGNNPDAEDNPFGPEIAVEDTNKAETSKSSQRTRSRASSLSLSAIFDCDKNKLVSGESVNKEDAAEFDLNISFSGGYVPNTDLSRVDKG